MSDAMMASRITLLLLVTGLFAGMWSNDRADERSAPALLARRSAARCDVNSTNLRVAPTSASSALRARTDRRRTAVPLPSGIAAGTYLIVDGRGRTQTRVVSAAEAFAGRKISRHVAADQYTTRIGRERWHFIRLDVAANSLATLRATSKSN